MCARLPTAGPAIALSRERRAPRDATRRAAQRSLKRPRVGSWAPGLLAPVRVRLGDHVGLAVHGRFVLSCYVADGVVRLILAPGPDHQHGARALAGAHEDVLSACGTVDEVPLPKRALLSFQDQDAFSVQHEEVLLDGLPVVAAVGLSRLEHLYVDAGVRPRRVVGLEVDDGRAPRVTAGG